MCFLIEFTLPRQWRPSILNFYTQSQLLKQQIYPVTDCRGEWRSTTCFHVRTASEREAPQRCVGEPCDWGLAHSDGSRRVLADVSAVPSRVGDGRRLPFSLSRGHGQRGFYDDFPRATSTSSRHWKAAGNLWQNCRIYTLVYYRIYLVSFIIA